MGVIMWRPSVANLKERLRIYKEAYEAKFKKAIPMGARTAIVRDTFVAESEAEARRIAGDAAMGSSTLRTGVGRRIYLDPGETLDAETEAQLKKKLTYEFVSERALLFGLPDDVAAKLEHLYRETNIEQVIFKCSFLALPTNIRCAA